MKLPGIAAILFAVFGFMALVVWSTWPRSDAFQECQVCLVFNGEEVCRNGRGPSELEALQAAQESVCGGNTSGMAEIIACRNANPVSSQCPPPAGP